MLGGTIWWHTSRSRKPAFDEATDKRNGNDLVFVLTKVDAPVHVLAESNDEAALFDAPVRKGIYSLMFTVRI